MTFTDVVVTSTGIGGSIELPAINVLRAGDRFDSYFVPGAHMQEDRARRCWPRLWMGTAITAAPMVIRTIGSRKRRQARIARRAVTR